MSSTSDSIKQMVEQHCDPLLNSIKGRLTRLERKVTVMHEELKKQIDRINQATNNVAARLDKLADQLKNGVTKDEATTMVSELQSLADHLEAMGTDPNNPVPNVNPPTT